MDALRKVIEDRTGWQIPALVRERMVCTEVALHGLGVDALFEKPDF